IRVWQRTFYVTARNAHVISNGARTSAPERRIAAAENHLLQRLELAYGQLAAWNSKAEVLVRRARQSEDFLEASYNPRRIDRETVAITSPLARKMLGL